MKFVELVWRGCGHEYQLNYGGISQSEGTYQKLCPWQILVGPSVAEFLVEKQAAAPACLLIYSTVSCGFPRSCCLTGVTRKLDQTQPREERTPTGRDCVFIVCSQALCKPMFDITHPLLAT